MTQERIHVEAQEEESQEKINALYFQECPLCKKKIQINVQFDLLEQQYGASGGILPHIILHGNPLHAMLCYVDRHMAVRGKGYIVSIGIPRDSNTYQQFVQLWSQSTLELIE
jgi:hypothetical protein